MIADDANPERRTLWAVLAWLEGWQDTDTLADNGPQEADIIQRQAKGQIEKIKRTLNAK